MHLLGPYSVPGPIPGAQQQQQQQHREHWLKFLPSGNLWSNEQILVILLLTQN